MKQKRGSLGSSKGVSPAVGKRPFTQAGRLGLIKIEQRSHKHPSGTIRVPRSPVIGHGTHTKGWHDQQPGHQTTWCTGQKHPTPSH